MVKRNKLPAEGELVVGTVREVKGFGAFVTLDEYPGKEGFIHIAEVASGWVKYVRDHVRENQKVVCKVTAVDPTKGHVDLSLKRVNEHQRREKINEWKNEQKADKLLELLCGKLGTTVDKALEEFGWKLMDTFGGLHAAFEAAAMDPEALAEEGLTGPWVQPFVDLARENISIPFVTVKGFVELTSYAHDGVEKVKKALLKALDTEYEDIDVKVQYVGAPRYRIKVKAPDYKSAEEELKAAAERAIAVIKKTGGEGTFVRAEA
ncbi:MAG: translation initiation factor IF-2 subunit alpha [Thermoplasmatota archaeon]